ncbi:MAG: transcription elongation factor GreA [Anaerolineales bacterium]
MAREERDLVLTREGAAKVEAELKELEGPKRQDLAKRLRFAIKQGDLSENADYIAAKEEQAFLEGRIQELKAILRKATIVDERTNTDEVGVGSTVVIAEDGRPQQTYKLVGATEANPREGKISNESPIGRALLGKRVGNTAIATTPAGEIEMEVIEIR